MMLWLVCANKLGLGHAPKPNRRQSSFKLARASDQNSDLLLLVTWSPVLLYAFEEFSVSGMWVRRRQMCKQKQKRYLSFNFSFGFRRYWHGKNAVSTVSKNQEGWSKVQTQAKTHTHIKQHWNVFEIYEASRKHCGKVLRDTLSSFEFLDFGF